MANWLELLDNPKSLIAIYGDEVPRLDGIELEELRLERGWLSLRFDLPDYPSKPPEKWRKKGANTVQVELNFVPLRDVDISRWGVSRRADLSLVWDVGIVVAARGSEVELTATSDSVSVANVSAYMNDDGLTP